MNKDQILGLIRHGLTFVGGILVTYGVTDEATIATISGSAVSLVGIIWSAFIKQKTTSNEEK